MAWPNDANSLITAASRTDLNRVPPFSRQMSTA